MTDTTFRLECGDSLEILKTIPDNSIDAVVTDPPYGLGKPPNMLEVLKAWLNTGCYDVMGKGFMGKCYHPDTDILTDSGWKHIYDVNVGDLVASLNPDTREISYVTCSKTFVYDFNGELSHIHGRSIQALVTPNHNVVLEHIKSGKLEFRRADSLPHHFRMINQGKWVGKVNCSEITIGGKSYPAEAFFLFLGLFLGDGYTVSRVAHARKQDFFGFSVFKDRKKKIIREALIDLAVKFTETPCNKDGMTAFYVYDKPLLGYLKKLGKARYKYIPNDLFFWDSTFLDKLYEGLINTDGCVQGYNDQHVYHTVSNRLADDFQRLCLHTGRSCVQNKKVRKDTIVNGNVAKSCGFMWSMSVTQKNKVFWMEKINHKKPSVHNYDETPYIGRVYCVELEKNHILLSRINGRTVWCGNSWDAFVPQPILWKEVYRVLKPGGHLLSFFGTRTYDLGVLALRLAGFEIRDSLQWCFGSGFPKSQYISKAIDQKLGVEREVVGKGKGRTGLSAQPNGGSVFSDDAYQWPVEYNITVPSSEEANRFSGFGTHLKPAHEPIVLCRKPVEGTIAENVLKHGTGGLNIDGCRINPGIPVSGGGANFNAWRQGEGRDDRPKQHMVSQFGHDKGRFPANIIHDGSPEVTQYFPESKGQQGDVSGKEPSHTGDEHTNCYGEYKRIATPKRGDSISASASRFFKSCPYTQSDADDFVTYFPEDAKRLIYCPKASKKDRDQGCESLPRKQYSHDGRKKAIENPYQRNDSLARNNHTCVKPTSLMRYLCRLITPPNGIVLDPFMGSGSTGKGAKLEGFSFIGIDMEEDNCKIAKARIENAVDDPETYIPVQEKLDDGEYNGGIFDL